MTQRQLALVTGASSGTGFELAKQFARHGYDLVVAAEDDAINDVPGKLSQFGAAVQPVHQMPGSYQPVYNASKSFIQSFAQAVHDELRDTAITVTALMPGPTDTNFFGRAKMADSLMGEMRKDDPARGRTARIRGTDAG